MIFHGFQKMTLLDFPSKVACTVFTGGCNFSCPFCHNALLVTELEDAECISQDVIFDFLEKRKGILDGVAVTGGEPLICDDIIDFIRQVKNMGFAVKLDTNGSFPDRLKYVIDGGLVDYVAMDVKNSQELYAETIGIDNFDITPVEKSIDILLEGRTDYEFRTTVVDKFHTVESIENIAKRLKGAKRYFLQCFTDSGNLIGEGMSAVPKDEMILMRETALKYIPDTEIRGF